MTTIISVVNLKGGVGKTALAVNLAAYCGRLNRRTLLVDVDPQTNATFSILPIDAWEAHAESNGTVADLLGARAHTSATGAVRDAATIIRPNVWPNVDLVPSHLDLFTVDLDLASATARERRLKRALESVLDAYEIVVCDCPPNLTLPTQNALAMSSHFVVPISPDFLSSLGVALLLTRVRRFADEMEHEIALAGMVISRVGRPALHREQTVATLRDQWPDDVLLAMIRERVAVASSAASNQPIFEMGDAAATHEFTAVCRELLTRLGV